MLNFACCGAHYQLRFETAAIGLSTNAFNSNRRYALRIENPSIQSWIPIDLLQISWQLIGWSTFIWRHVSTLALAKSISPPHLLFRTIPFSAALFLKKNFVAQSKLFYPQSSECVLHKTSSIPFCFEGRRVSCAFLCREGTSPSKR